MLRRLLLLVFFSISAQANAVELREIEVRKGTAGLSPVPLDLTNASEASLLCIGELAHWYSTEVARIETGTTARVDLWFDPKSGTYTLLNDSEENMPLEALWCGRAGRAYETRGRILLDRSPDRVPDALDLACTLNEDQVRCE
ncbi:MAG: hypothetical protein NXI27_26320 [Alphaproteobacteria bacterium]|nr:hypothetical protein [Alphaproteobacteria bacterium]